MPTRCAAALSAAAALSTTPLPARGQTLETVRLVATRGAGAEACPDGDVLRDAVRARLGADPFDDASATRVEVTFSRAHHGLRAELRVTAPDATDLAPRVIRSRRRDCRALSDATALAASLVVTTLAPRAPAPTPAPTPTPPPAPAPPPQTAELRATVIAGTSTPRPWTVTRAPAPTAVTPRWEVHLDALGAWGATPSLTGALSLGGSWRRGALSLGLDLRGVWPGVEESLAGSVSIAAVTATPAACLHRGVFMACGVVSVGAVIAEGRGAAINHRVNTPTVRAGARVGVVASPGSTITLRAWAEVDAPMTLTEHRVDDAVVWTTAPVAVTLAAGVGVRIP